MPEIVHVLPVNDLIAHEEEGFDCPCGVSIEYVDPDGCVVTHHSLDGRELTEEDTDD